MIHRHASKVCLLDVSARHIANMSYKGGSCDTATLTTHIMRGLTGPLKQLYITSQSVIQKPSLTTTTTPTILTTAPSDVHAEARKPCLTHKNFKKGRKNGLLTTSATSGSTASASVYSKTLK